MKDNIEYELIATNVAIEWNQKALSDLLIDMTNVINNSISHKHFPSDLISNYESSYQMYLKNLYKLEERKEVLTNFSEKNNGTHL